MLESRRTPRVFCGKIKSGYLAAARFAAFLYQLVACRRARHKSGKEFRIAGVGIFEEKATSDQRYRSGVTDQGIESGQIEEQSVAARVHGDWSADSETEQAVVRELEAPGVALRDRNASGDEHPVCALTTQRNHLRCEHGVHITAADEDSLPNFKRRVVEQNACERAIKEAGVVLVDRADVDGLDGARVADEVRASFTDPHGHGLGLSRTVRRHLQNASREERLRGGDNFHAIGDQAAV